MPTVRTIEQTVSTALHGVTAQLITDGKALDHVISALEEREAQMLDSIWKMIEESEGDGFADTCVYTQLRSAGFLGT